MSRLASLLVLLVSFVGGCERRYDPTLFYGTWVLDGPGGPIAQRTIAPRGGIFLADQFTVTEAVYVGDELVVTRFGDGQYNREPHPGWDGRILQNILFLQYSSDSPTDVPGISLPEAGTVWYEEVLAVGREEMVVRPPTLARELHYRRLSDSRGVADASPSDATVLVDAGADAAHGDDAGVEEPFTLSATLRRIEPGTFTRGCVTGRDEAGAPCAAAETPSHEVTLTRAYWLMRTELTQEMWAAMGFRDPSQFGATFTACGTNCPVETITWWEALTAANAASSAEGLPNCYSLAGCTGAVGNGDAFEPYVCTELTVNTASGSPLDCTGYRLPTEAEWEYAARGGESFAYAGSGVDDEVAWSSTNVGAYVAPTCGGGPCTRPACRKRANAFDLCDLSGNVEEYVWDGFAPYRVDALTDPLGGEVSSTTSPIVRGGSFSTDDVRVARREGAYHAEMQAFRGLRLARTAE